MGTWSSRPWSNDKAADWFGELFDEVGVRSQVRATLDDEARPFEEIRAAATILLFLGRVYIWPIEHLTEDLEAAARRLREGLASAGVLGLTTLESAEIGHEIRILQRRIAASRSSGQPTSAASVDIEDSEPERAWWLALR